MLPNLAMFWLGWLQAPSSQPPPHSFPLIFVFLCFFLNFLSFYSFYFSIVNQKKWSLFLKTNCYGTWFLNLRTSDCCRGFSMNSSAPSSKHLIVCDVNIIRDVFFHVCNLSNFCVFVLTFLFWLECFLMTWSLLGLSSSLVTPAFNFFFKFQY